MGFGRRFQPSADDGNAGGAFHGAAARTFDVVEAAFGWGTVRRRTAWLRVLRLLLARLRSGLGEFLALAGLLGAREGGVGEFADGNSGSEDAESAVEAEQGWGGDEGSEDCHVGFGLGAAAGG
jgi:hypothetical protein